MDGGISFSHITDSNGANYSADTSLYAWHIKKTYPPAESGAIHEILLEYPRGTELWVADGLTGGGDYTVHWHKTKGITLQSVANPNDDYGTASCTVSIEFLDTQMVVKRINSRYNVEIPVDKVIVFIIVAPGI